METFELELYGDDVLDKDWLDIMETCFRRKWRFEYKQVLTVKQINIKALSADHLSWLCNYVKGKGFQRNKW